MPPVVMGTNQVAQIQAEALLRDCTLSHWGTDGLKPYHAGIRWRAATRLTRKLRPQPTNAELLYTWLQWNDAPEEMLRESVDSLLSSPIHRGVMLSPAYQQVNFGLAWNRTVFKTVAHFEGDYTELTQLPAFTDGDLSFAGRLKERYQFNHQHPLGVRVYYDPEPRALTQGQLIRTSCYWEGDNDSS